MSLIPRWRPITKRTLDLFGRWGDPRTNLRAMLDTVLPVAVVDTFRDDDEGSVFGMQAFTQGTPNELPSISFGSAVNDWELLQITAATVNFNGTNLQHVVKAHLFTPIDPYNPATTITPVGFFTAGLLPNRSFTFGSVRAIAGTNPVAPVILGPDVRFVFFTFAAARFEIAIVDYGAAGGGYFTVPQRIYRDVTLTLQFVGTIDAVQPTGLSASILYRERPKVSAE